MQTTKLIKSYKNPTYKNLNQLPLKKTIRTNTISVNSYFLQFSSSDEWKLDIGVKLEEQRAYFFNINPVDLQVPLDTLPIIWYQMLQFPILLKYLQVLFTFSWLSSCQKWHIQENIKRHWRRHKPCTYEIFKETPIKEKKGKKNYTKKHHRDLMPSKKSRKEPKQEGFNPGKRQNNFFFFKSQKKVGLSLSNKSCTSNLPIIPLFPQTPN